jgi:choline dehydrogenase-like flavoprotein
MLTPKHPYRIVRGATLGGSTAINGTYCVRPPDSDIIRWHDILRDDTWSKQNFHRVFRDVETDTDFPDHPDHGSTGPIPIQRDIPDALDQAVLSAWSEVTGLDFSPDVSLTGNPGVGMLPKNAVGGRRFDAGSVFLRPLMDRRLVEVRGRTRVARVVISRGVATGVQVETEDGSLEHIAADRVVLCAGAVGSATLLLRSGVGPRAVIEAAGGQCLVDSPTIGQQFSDHPSVSVSFTPTPLYRHQALTKPPFSQVVRFTVGHHTLEVLPVSRPLPTLLGVDLEGTEITWLVSLLTPTSRGTLTLDPRGLDYPPVITYEYLSDEAEGEALAEAVTQVVRVLAHDSFRPYVTKAPEISTAVEAHDYVLANLGTSYHTTSTVPAGPGGSGAVDSRGMVVGVKNLQVADVSILPDGPARGPSYLAMALGWMLGSQTVSADSLSD